MNKAAVNVCLYHTDCITQVNTGKPQCGPSGKHVICSCSDPELHLVSIYMLCCSGVSPPLVQNYRLRPTSAGVSRSVITAGRPGRLTACRQPDPPGTESSCLR